MVFSCSAMQFDNHNSIIQPRDGGEIADLQVQVGSVRPSGTYSVTYVLERALYTHYT